MIFGYFQAILNEKTFLLSRYNKRISHVCQLVSQDSQSSDVLRVLGLGISKSLLSANWRGVEVVKVLIDELVQKYPQYNEENGPS
jgi:hypothetical protein